MNTQIIARYLVYLRQIQRLTQEELSEYLNISRQAISKWENGISLPDIETLLKLSNLYQISINDILVPNVKTQISDFEEILDIDNSILVKILAYFHTSDIVKASMGASPNVNLLLNKLLQNIDFDKERGLIGSVKVEEIICIHTQIVSAINMEL